MRYPAKEYQVYIEVKIDKIEPPKDFYVPPAPPPLPTAQTVIKYIAPVVVDTYPPIEKTQPAISQILAIEFTTIHLKVSGTDQMMNL